MEPTESLDIAPTEPSVQLASATSNRESRERSDRWKEFSRASLPWPQRKGESETVEFKQGFDRDVIETLAAFVNSRGESVFLGVSDAGEVVAVNEGKKTVQNWVNQIKQSTGMWLTSLP